MVEWMRQWARTGNKINKTNTKAPLGQWFSTFLMLWAFNTVLHVMMTPPTIKLFLLLLPNCNFAVRIIMWNLICLISDMRHLWKCHSTPKGIMTHRLKNTPLRNKKILHTDTHRHTHTHTDTHTQTQTHTHTHTHTHTSGLHVHKIIYKNYVCALVGKVCKVTHDRSQGTCDCVMGPDGTKQMNCWS